MERIAIQHQKLAIRQHIGVEILVALTFQRFLKYCLRVLGHGMTKYLYQTRIQPASVRFDPLIHIPNFSKYLQTVVGRIPVILPSFIDINTRLLFILFHKIHFVHQCLEQSCASTFYVIASYLGRPANNIQRPIARSETKV